MNAVVAREGEEIVSDPFGKSCDVDVVDVVSAVGDPGSSVDGDGE